MPPLDPLLRIALDLTATLAAEDRYRRLVEAVRQVAPGNAVCLLRQEGEALVPVASMGLVPEVDARRFAIAEHPRLRAILAGPGPVRFAPDSPLPDPFDGLLADDPGARAQVHACMGTRLVVGDRVVGALTLDAHAPGAFDHLDDGTVATLGALAGAAMHTAGLIGTLEATARQRGLVADELVHEAHRRGAELVGASAAMQQLRAEIELVAASDLTVLVTGETGTGKELVANQLHLGSRRARAPLINVNCAALPESIAESELFGHRRGAFTGADADRPGKFEVASGGTLFLDEVGELPQTVQPKLLRALQVGEVQRVGADRAVHVDVRVIAATNRDLAAEVDTGHFRADLYHRLSVYPLHVPPLRERRDDIPLLAGHFLDQARMRVGTGPLRLDAAARQALQDYAWPGNVRELEHVLLRAAVRAAGAAPRHAAVVLEPSHLGLESSAPAPVEPLRASMVPVQVDRPLREAVEDFQRAYIRRALEAAQGNWAAAARMLGLDRGNFHRLAQRLGVGGRP